MVYLIKTIFGQYHVGPELEIYKFIEKLMRGCRSSDLTIVAGI